MTVADIRNIRLYNQLIAASTCVRPSEVVKHLVAMQSQEYAQAKWAIGLRLPKSTNTVVEQAFNEGSILRTHVLRPTWHFVCPEDIRWLVELTAPRVHAYNAPYYRKAELDSKILARTTNILAKSLQGNQYLTRKEIQEILERSSITADGLRLVLIMMYAELEGVICSGPRQGNQFSYALMDERVAPAKAKSRDEALAGLTLRYFTSRGPATVNDLAWWSGLTVKDCRQGVAMVNDLERVIVNDIEYVYYPTSMEKTKSWQSTFLMPDYDEYGISYKDRSVLFDGDEKPKPDSAGFNHMLVVDGMVAGRWKRHVKGKMVTAEVRALEDLSATKAASVKKAVERFHNFMSA